MQTAYDKVQQHGSSSMNFYSMTTIIEYLAYALHQQGNVQRSIQLISRLIEIGKLRQ